MQQPTSPRASNLMARASGVACYIVLSYLRSSSWSLTCGYFSIEQIFGNAAIFHKDVTKAA